MSDSITSRNFVSMDFYVLRVPTLPFTQVLELNANSVHSYEALNESLKEIFKEKDMQEKMFLASPQVYFEILKWVSDPAFNASSKLLLTLYKYVLRNGFRCTPYGLFSGCSVGTLSPLASTILLEDAEYRRLSRLDMGYTMDLVNHISESEFLQQTKLFTNTSLYAVGNTYRYCDYKINDSKREYFISEIVHTPYLAIVFEAAKNGIYFADLVKLLLSEDIEPEDAHEFIQTLINIQALVSDLNPRLTDPSILSTLINTLEERGYKDYARLNEIKLIAQLISCQSRDKLGDYAEVRSKLNLILPPAQEKDLIQTDLMLGLKQNVLKQASVDEIIEAVAQLTFLNPKTENADLKEFKRKFLLRYEEREVPLLMALDTDLGFGYGTTSGDLTFHSPILEGLSFTEENVTEQTIWTPFQQWLLKAYIEAEKNNTNIEITDVDLQNFKADQSSLTRVPYSFYIMGSIISDSQHSFDMGNYHFLFNSCGGSSAFNLLGRFASNNNELYQQMKKYACLETTQNQGKIIAEIVHHAEDRVGNILIRPNIFDYEISFLGNTSAEDDFRISAADLMISVKNDRVVLRSKRLQKEIIPRLTSAHNFKNGLPVYRFLCDLQFQDTSLGIQWNWSFLKKESYLPRVTYKKIILSRARWLLNHGELKNGNASSKPTEHDNLLRLLKERKIPMQVLLAEGDNELYLDLNNLAAREILLRKLAKASISLFEYLPTSFLKQGDNCYTNEVIIPVVNTKYNSVPHDLMPTQRFERDHIPGSDWLYLKIYSSHKWIDYLLKNELSLLINAIQKKGMISKWFFLRYRDTDTHLRIRFKKDDGVKNFEKRMIDLVNQHLKPFIDQKIIHKLQYDTYVQELEKYGEDSIGHSESIFYHDSEAILGILNEVDENGSLRWMAALKAMDRTLDDFDFDLPEKLRFTELVYKNFIEEFAMHPALNRQLNDKFRQEKAVIEATLMVSEKILTPKILELLETRTKKNKPLIIALKNSNHMLSKLIGNYLHLTVNRIFAANQRVTELTLYHFLRKHYASQIARALSKK